MSIVDTFILGEILFVEVPTPQRNFIRPPGSGKAIN